MWYFIDLFFYFINYYYSVRGAHMPHCTCGGQKDACVELVLSFYLYVGFGDGTRVIGLVLLGCKHLYLCAILPASTWVLTDLNLFSSSSPTEHLQVQMCEVPQEMGQLLRKVSTFPTWGLALEEVMILLMTYWKRTELEHRKADCEELDRDLWEEERILEETKCTESPPPFFWRTFHCVIQDVNFHFPVLASQVLGSWAWVRTLNTGFVLFGFLQYWEWNPGPCSRWQVPYNRAVSLALYFSIIIIIILR